MTIFVELCWTIYIYVSKNPIVAGFTPLKLHAGDTINAFQK